MRKNVAGQTLSAHLVSKTDGSDVAAGTTNVFVTKDGGTQAAGGGVVAHQGNGEWSYAPTQAETNADHVAFTFVNAAAVSQTVNVYTLPANFPLLSIDGIGRVTTANPASGGSNTYVIEDSD